MKRHGTEGGDDGAVLSELQTNRGSGHGHVHASRLVLYTRRGHCGKVQAFRQDSRGGVRAIALGHPAGGLASGVGVSLGRCKILAAFTTNCGIHLVAALLRGGLGIAERPTCGRGIVRGPLTTTSKKDIVPVDLAARHSTRK